MIEEEDTERSGAMALADAIALVDVLQSNWQQATIRAQLAHGREAYGRELDRVKSCKLEYEQAKAALLRLQQGTTTK